MFGLSSGIIPESYFDRIKEWIGGDKEKIRFIIIESTIHTILKKSLIRIY